MKICDRWVRTLAFLQVREAKPAGCMGFSVMVLIQQHPEDSEMIEVAQVR